MEITTVNNTRQRTEFIRFPFRLHKDNPAWVPPLISELKGTLDEAKNPFYQHAEQQLFLAHRDGAIVGRIAAIIDRNYIQVQGEQVGSFGFFDAVDDREVAARLFDAAAEWLKERGMKRMLGPTNPSMNDELGVLADAFDQPPAVKMVWNPPYYPALYEACGFGKAMDLWAWTMHQDDVTDRLKRAGEAILKRSKVTLRNVNMKKFDQEVALLREVYNEAWSDNWGFVPWTREEFEHSAKMLKQVIDPSLVFIAEDKGRPVGFSLALPDINAALKHTNGRLFPFGLFKLLWYARKIHFTRIPILGVIKEYRNRGVDTAMYWETFRVGTSKGYDSAEMSWILENNTAMNNALTKMGAHKYKTYRLYQREL